MCVTLYIIQTVIGYYITELTRSNIPFHFRVCLKHLKMVRMSCWEIGDGRWRVHNKKFNFRLFVDVMFFNKLCNDFNNIDIMVKCRNKMSSMIDSS